jgi:hypothetical protein
MAEKFLFPAPPAYTPRAIYDRDTCNKAYCLSAHYNEELKLPLHSVLECKSKQISDTYRCLMCSRLGHHETMCTNSQKQNEDAHDDYVSVHVCYHCGESGHLEGNCPDKQDDSIMQSYPATNEDQKFADECLEGMLMDCS